MAYSFNGTNQRLSTASAPVTAAPLTMFCRFNATTLPPSSWRALMYSVATSTSDFFELAIDFRAGDANSQTNWRARQSVGPVSANPAINNTVSTGSWVSQTGVEAATNSRNVFFDTTKSTTNTTTCVPANIANFNIGGRTASNFFDGLISEVAIWDVGLNDDEVTSLARGFKPLRVRPQNLQFYAPIVRELRDWRKALTITNNNSATVADHPRVY